MKRCCVFCHVQEYLKQFAMAVESYSKGVELSEAHLGSHQCKHSVQAIHK